MIRRSVNAVKIGPDYFRVKDLADAQSTWNAARDSNSWGGRNAPDCTACVDRKLYRISYNGRIWDAGTGEEVVL